MRPIPPSLESAYECDTCGNPWAYSSASVGCSSNMRVRVAANPFLLKNSLASSCAPQETAQSELRERCSAEANSRTARTSGPGTWPTGL